MSIKEDVFRPDENKPECTCPSGDGSLRWQCPVHPPVVVSMPDDVRDSLQDSAYLHGVTAGWNAAQSDEPNATLKNIQDAYSGHLKPLRDRQKAGRPSAASRVPDGYVMVPEKANIAMIRAGAKAARQYLEEHGGNSPQVIYQAMLAAAPSPTSDKGGE